MKTLARMLVIAVAACWASGCVSLDKHRQLEMTHRTAMGEKAQVEQELFDCRSVTDNLRNQVTSLEGELDTKERLVANLQDENDRLEGAFASAQKTLESLADKPLPLAVVLRDTILPEALDSALKRFATQYPSSVAYDPTRGTVKWKSDLLFALGSDVVKESARASLAGFAEIIALPEASQFEVIVVGHTDDRPITREATRRIHPTNWHLSVHRSIAVADVLQTDGTQPTRVGVMGYGEYRPLKANASEENRALNRRVEIHIVPAGSIVGGGQEGAVADLDTVTK